MAADDEVQLLKEALAEREEQALEKERQLERYAADLRETFKQERARAQELRDSYVATVRAGRPSASLARSFSVSAARRSPPASRTTPQ